MISLVLPYWQRQEATDASLALLARHYADLDLEVVIVDDGSPEPYVPIETGLRQIVMYLPIKSEPLNACVPINAGVRVSSGDIIALSSPEIRHEAPVLGAMREELRRLGPDGYVIAACWAPENQVWHSHSSLAGRPAEGVAMPAWANFHFLSMLHRDLWERAGGMDEDYRPGQAFDDADLVLRLARAGAVGKTRDDLVVHHPRSGCKAKTDPIKHEFARKLFLRKWR